MINLWIYVGTVVALSLIHISEPTRPLYIPYAVFCLKKWQGFLSIWSVLFLMIRRPPRSTHCISSAASDVYKRQVWKYEIVIPFYIVCLSVGQEYSTHIEMPILLVNSCKILAFARHLLSFEQGGIFIVPHLLWHGASSFGITLLIFST